MSTMLMADWTRERALSGERVHARQIADEFGGDHARVEETLWRMHQEGRLAWRRGVGRGKTPIRLYQRIDRAPKSWSRPCPPEESKRVPATEA